MNYYHKSVVPNFSFVIWSLMFRPIGYKERKWRAAALMYRVSTVSVGADVGIIPKMFMAIVNNANQLHNYLK
jgi:hypothetical protein